MPDQLARGFEPGGAISQPETHRLVVEDGGAKALALLGIGNRHLQRAARHAHALRGNADAPTLQATQGDLVALALLTQPVLNRNAALVKVDLRRVAAVLTQLVLQAGHPIAWRVGRHQKGAHALFASTPVGHSHDDGHVAMLAAGDELLHAIDHITVAITHGRSPQS